MNQNFDFLPTPSRMQWWLDARFGVSYHWGLYSAPGRGEWVRSSEHLTVEEYQPYFDSFGAEGYNPREWARLARQAGARYAVLTAKHHDGFCLFDSAHTEYKATRTPAKRDLVREYVEAFREEGLRVGLYYSLVDWHHPDYPGYGDRQHPLRKNAAFKDATHNWDVYKTYLHNQVRELLTNYGTIDLLLFDFSYWGFAGEKWGASELMSIVRALQPEIVVNDRLSNAESGSLKDATPPAWAGDFDTCELNLPTEPPRNAHGQILPWDLWITHNNGWGYVPADTNYKSADALIRALVNCVSKGGNLTLNFAPDGRGALPDVSMQVQEEIGCWMAKNGESIYGCGMSPFARPDWGRYTNKGSKLYAHVLEPTMGLITLPGLRGKVRNPRVVADGSQAYMADFWNKPVQVFARPEDIFFNWHQPTQQTYTPPDPTDTVVAFDLVPENEQVAEVQRQTSSADDRAPFA